MSALSAPSGPDRRFAWEAAGEPAIVRGTTRTADSWRLGAGFGSIGFRTWRDSASDKARTG